MARRAPSIIDILSLSKKLDAVGVQPGGNLPNYNQHMRELVSFAQASECARMVNSGLPPLRIDDLETYGFRQTVDRRTRPRFSLFAELSNL